MLPWGAPGALEPKPPTPAPTSSTYGYGSSYSSYSKPAAPPAAAADTEPPGSFLLLEAGVKGSFAQLLSKDVFLGVFSVSDGKEDRDASRRSPKEDLRVLSMRIFTTRCLHTFPCAYSSSPDPRWVVAPYWWLPSICPQAPEPRPLAIGRTCRVPSLRPAGTCRCGVRCGVEMELVECTSAF